MPDATDPMVVTEQLNSYVVSETHFEATVKEVKQLEAGWWDVLVDYRIHLTKVYEAVLQHEMVQDGFVKPAADFGQVVGAAAMH